jgi:hypothetical protein
MMSSNVDNNIAGAAYSNGKEHSGGTSVHDIGDTSNSTRGVAHRATTEL